MKKLTLLALFVSVTVFQFCSSSKKAAAEAPKVSYAKNVHPVIQGSCSPCHIAGKGKAKSLDNYEAAKTAADDMIARIKKNPGEKGFMPMRHDKLPDSTIAVFEKWKEAGFTE